MHIHASHDIAVATKATVPAGPIATRWLLAFPTRRTRAAGSPLTAREARQVGLLAFLLQVIDIFAILPARHPLVVMPTRIFVPHAIRVAHIHRLHAFLLAEVHHLPGGFVPLVAHLALRIAFGPLLGILQPSPALRSLLAPALQPLHLTQRHIVPAFGAADAASGDHERLARIRRHRRQMDLSQVHRRLGWVFGKRWRRRVRNGNDNMQGIAPIPDQGHRSDLFRQSVQMKGQRFAASSHRQQQRVAGAVHRLAGHSTVRYFFGW